jgi:signal transduction histidine kinase
MDLQRIAATVAIGATGLGLLVVAALALPTVGRPSGLLMVGATLLLGGAFTLSGPLLYRSEVQSAHLLRVAGWNTLGVVATTAVLGLVAAFQAATAGSVTAPLLSGAIVVGVSAFTHVLIGFNDVRRIRARTVAKQRQKAAVVNRFVRHDLSHAAQLLFSYGEQIRADGGVGGDAVDVGQRVREIGDDLADTQDRIGIIDDLLERSPESRSIDVRALVEEQRNEWTEAHPDGSLTVDVPDGIEAAGGEHVEQAIGELVENAFEHGGDPPAVTIRGRQTDGAVEIEILDDGDGFPEQERELINEDRTETQLHHSSGLGLWLAKWILEHYGGGLAVGDREDGTGGRATARLPADAGS